MRVVKLLGTLVLLPFLGISQVDPIAGNPGFEDPSALANWVKTGAGTVSIATTTQRSGGRCASITSLISADYTTLRNTSLSVAVPGGTGDNYVTVIAYARRGTGSGSLTVGIDSGTSALPDGPTVPGATNTNVTNTYARLIFTFKAVNGTTYHPVLYARSNAGGADNVRFDDVFIYTSTSPSADNNPPAAPTKFTVTTSGADVTFNFTQGADNPTNSAGINGVVILRNTSATISNSNSTLNAQCFYAPNSTSGAPSGFTVVYSGPPVSTFTNNLGAANQAVYLVYMRDGAFNYTASTAAGRVIVVNSATAGYTVANPPDLTPPVTTINLDALSIRAGNTLTISAGTVYSFRTLAESVIDGTINMVGNINTSSVPARLTFATGGTLRYNADGARAIPTATYQPGSTVLVNHTVAANAPNGGLTQPFGNFRWAPTVQISPFTLPNGFTANGNLEVINTDATSLELASGGTYNVRGNLQLDGRLTAAANSVLNLNGNGAVQTIGGTNPITPELATLNIATTGGGSVVLARDVEVTSAFGIAAGAILNGGSVGASLRLSGAAEFVNNGSYVPGDAKVVFASGNANRAIRGSTPTSFEKLEINNTGLAVVADRFVRLETPVTINNQLILTNGGLRTNNQVLSIENGAVVTATEAGNTEADELAFINSNQASYIALVDGAGVPATAGGVRRLNIGPGGRTTLVPFAVGYDMPVSASSTSFSPVAIQQSAGTADNYTVRSITADSPEGTFSASSVDYTYNLLEDVPGGADCSVRIYWQSDMEGAVFDRSFTSVVHSDGTTVDYFSPSTPAAAIAGGSADFWYQQGTGFTSFSPFSISSNPTILPFVFKTVRARREVQRAVLAWDIADDREIAQYLIERQTASGFVQVGSLPARQASGVQAYSFGDAQAPAGMAVYRIIAVGKNGQRTISPLVAIAAGNAAPQWIVSPNPVQQKRLNLQLQNMPAGQYQVRIVGQQGQVHVAHSFSNQQGSNTYQWQLPATLPAGMYRVVLSSSQGQQSASILLQ